MTATVGDVLAFRLDDGVVLVETTDVQSSEWPDTIEVEFAVKFSADSNPVIARAHGDTNLRIALRCGEPRSG